jgi:hypothetical protein
MTETCDNCHVKNDLVSFVVDGREEIPIAPSSARQNKDISPVELHTL